MFLSQSGSVHRGKTSNGINACFAFLVLFPSYRYNRQVATAFQSLPSTALALHIITLRKFWTCCMSLMAWVVLSS